MRWRCGFSSYDGTGQWMITGGYVMVELLEGMGTKWFYLDNLIPTSREAMELRSAAVAVELLQRAL